METASGPSKFSSRKELKLHSDPELFCKPAEGMKWNYES